MTIFPVSLTSTREYVDHDGQFKKYSILLDGRALRAVRDKYPEDRVCPGEKSILPKPVYLQKLLWLIVSTCLPDALEG